MSHLGGYYFLLKMKICGKWFFASIWGLSKKLNFSCWVFPFLFNFDRNIHLYHVKLSLLLATKKLKSINLDLF